MHSLAQRHTITQPNVMRPSSAGQACEAWWARPSLKPKSCRAAGAVAALGLALVPFYTGKIIDFATIDPDEGAFKRTTLKLVRSLARDIYTESLYTEIRSIWGDV